MAGGGGSDRAASAAPPSSRAVTVDRLAHEGIPEICALYKRVWDRYPDLPGDRAGEWVPTELGFASWMEDGIYFVARQNGRTIGAIGCERRDGNLRIVRLAVDPDFRRQGVGTALARQAVEWARRARVGSIWVDALRRFDAAAALFLRLGFVECGGFHRHYWNEDVRLFEKTL